jgi:hypothetical protein
MRPAPHQLSDPPTAARGGRVTPQDGRHDRTRTDPRLRDVVGSDGGIASGGQLERSCGMSGRAEDVLEEARNAGQAAASDAARVRHSPRPVRRSSTPSQRRLRFSRDG